MARLVDLVREAQPKYNPDIARGYASKEIKYGREYIQDVLKVAFAKLPKEVEYLGAASCDTKETFKALLNSSGKQNRFYEYAPTDTFLIKLLFKFKGVDLEPIYLALAYVKDGGIMRITGSRYCISPYLADIALSVTATEIFVPLTRDRVNFKRSTHQIKYNGLTVIGNVVWCNLYRDSKRSQAKSKKTVVMNTTVVHYLFAKYGFTETAKRMGIEGLIVDDDDAGKMEFADKGYHIFESGRPKVKGTRAVGLPTRIWVAIHPSNLNEQARDFITSFYYVVDHFPDKVMVADLDDPTRWLILLAHAIFANGAKEALLYELIQYHIDSIEDYVDDVAKQWLHKGGVDNINDIYDLMVEIATSYSRRRQEASRNSTSSYGKYLLVNRYVYHDVVRGIFWAKYQLQAAIRNKGDNLTAGDITKILKANINTKTITKLNQSSHPEVEPASTPGPYMALKLTNRVVLQTSMRNKSKGSKLTFKPATDSLDASLAQCHEPLSPTKSEGTGRGYISCYLRPDENGSVNLVDEVEFINQLNYELK